MTEALTEIHWSVDIFLCCITHEYCHDLLPDLCLCSALVGSAQLFLL